MYFKNNAQKYGYTFGKICRVLGLVSTLIFSLFVPNEDTILNIWAFIAFVVSILVFLYGYWRTGGWNEE